jgi:thiamine pyrophosphate-dependent acetolactate synthase large subunit-like protein
MPTSFQPDALSVSVTRPPAPEWGSDVVAEMLRRLGVEYVALNPGSSFRGLHDSLVNYNANAQPALLLCNHEEVAVALAHGYAKASGRPMAAAVHSNVGLLHASMSIFNAWVDRVPVLVLGATGPLDSTRRRPWIDWIHTAQGQGEVVRDYTKWEGQPAAVAAIPEAMLRAWRAMLTEPRGPVYLCLDAGQQEERLDPSQPLTLPDPARFPIAAPPPPPAAAVEEAARWLAGAEFPVLLLGRSGNSAQGWEGVVELAELLGAAVLTDAKSPASFPTDHPLHLTSPSLFGDGAFHAVLEEADLVLALERIDPAGTLHRGRPAAARPAPPRLINVSLEDLAVRSWAADYQEVCAADLPILSTADQMVAALLPEVRRLMRDDGAAQERARRRAAAHGRRRTELEGAWAAAREAAWPLLPMRMIRLVGELWHALGAGREEAVLVRGPLTWPAGVWDFRRPGSYLGYDGGAGIGSGPGMAVGAALALRTSGRLPIAILGDGDVLMAPTALWTAAHHHIPLLVVVANNRSYFNDEEHQERVARARARPAENRWIGQRMDDPPVNFAGLARDLGAEGFGPVEEPTQLAGAYAAALRAVREGRPALVDVRVSTA